MEMTATQLNSVNMKYRRKIYKVIKPIYFDFIEYVKIENGSDTYNIAMVLVSKFESFLEESKQALNFIDDYIDLNITASENKTRYGLLVDEYRSELVKLDSYVTKTIKHFNSRKNMMPFVENDGITNLFLKALDLLIESYTNCITFQDGVKEKGVTYLVELSSSIY